LGFLLAWQLNSKSKSQENKVEVQDTFIISPWKHHFYCIILVEAVTKFSPGSRGGDINSTIGWKGYQDDIARASCGMEATVLASLTNMFCDPLQHLV
jgi:hypothetical protein